MMKYKLSISLFFILSFSNSFAANPHILKHNLNKNWNTIPTVSAAAKITITGSGIIRFLEVFFYDDTACTNLLGIASVIDNSTGFSFENEQTISLNSTAAYTLANNQGIATENIRCIQLYMDGGNQSCNGLSCLAFTDVTCSGTTCDSNQVKAANWVENPTSCTAPYAYATNKIANTISKCDIDQVTGELSQCVTTGSQFYSPTGIAINDQYASVTNQAGNSITKCKLNTSDGTLNDCKATGSGFKAPFELIYNTKYVYATNRAPSGVTKCMVNPLDGSFSNCAKTGDGFNSAFRHYHQ